MPFLEGLLFGLATAVLLGPVFFTLLKAALDHGAVGGIAVALGIFASDVVAVVLVVSGTSVVLHDRVDMAWVALVGGLLLGGMGVLYILRPKVKVDGQARLRRRTVLGLFGSGFLVNFVNPFVFAIWFGLVLHATEAHGPGIGLWTFLSGTLAGILLTDLLKAMLAPRLEHLLAPRVLRAIHGAIGVALLCFSLRLFMHAWEHWGQG